MATTSTNPPRHQPWRKRIALGGLALLLGAILVLGLKPSHTTSQLADTIQTCGHFAFFGLLAVLTAVCLPAVVPNWRRHAARSYAAGFAFSVLIGSTLEGLQALTPTRTPSWDDLIQDAFGALAGVSLLALVDRATPDRGMPRRLLIAALPTFLVMLVLGGLPLGLCLLDYYQRNQAFPQLHVFNDAWSGRFLWKDESVEVTPSAPPAGWPGDAGHDIADVLIPVGEKYPGVGFSEPVPNWNGYDAFAFDCLNAGDAVTMAMRIHDFAHNDDMNDRYNRVLEIAPGFQTIRIAITEIQTAPRNRHLDITSIEGFKLFALKPTQPLHLYLGNFRLEKR
ncbi:MAG: VanZ family protein [Planctomycetales bacterium]|nr:VanZ family protein [Planctomycetales bacterium]